MVSNVDSDGKRTRDQGRADASRTADQARAASTKLADDIDKVTFAPNFFVEVARNFFKIDF